ncbi:TetR/AcrR family transcriptional regulator [Kosakonia cowanii]|uniref:TetR/AcrR family transcriptional regulator n=1 Tax=Kosakonia cowanii TaxID=208223 RepID=UPI003EE68A71
MKTPNFSELIKMTALQLFKENGLNKVSTRDLTQKLNISRSHIYHYYRDWESLKIDAIQYMLDKDINEYHNFSQASEGLSATENVLHYIQYLLPDAPSAHWLLYLELWPMAARDNNYAQLVHNQYLRWRNILEEIINLGIKEKEFLTQNASASARKINALIDGYSSMLILEFTAEKRAVYIRELSELSFEIIKVSSR